ncbi:MAG TPA: hypothetical protein VLX44_14075 [Xanthobacteraceae bacterium]|nr:hypothetical protein [Xanthobacteraceae bacterium]
MRPKLVSALCLVAALSIGSVAALAQDERFVNDVDAKQRAACTPDVQRLCNQYIPDVPQIVACLKAQQASLSAACADVFSVPEDCKPDVQQLCAYAQLPGLVACLKQQSASLSAACAAGFAEMEPQPAAAPKPAKKAPAKKTATPAK